MYVHPTYAVTTVREPLGILDVWMWARKLRNASGQRGGPKESLRWIEGYERLAELAPRLPATRLVYVADREADMLPLMIGAQQLVTRPTGWCVPRITAACSIATNRDHTSPKAQRWVKSSLPWSRAPASSLNDVLRMVARAGGFLAKKGDGEPGAKTIWEGLRDVRASAHTLKTLHEMETLSSCV